MNPETKNFVTHSTTVCPSGEWVPASARWSMVLLDSGSAYWVVPDGNRELAVGDSVVTGGCVGGRLLCSQVGPSKIRWFMVVFEALPGLVSLRDRDALRALAVSTKGERVVPAGEPLGQRLLQFFGDDTVPALLQRARMLELVLTAISSHLPKSETPAAPPDVAIRLRNWVEQFPEAELMQISIEEVAREIGCSVRHLSRLFTAEVGKSFRQFQTELRMKRACQLLESSDAKIIEIAMESGYRHLGLFNSLFKRHFGMSPSQWRMKTEGKGPPRSRSRPGGGTLSAWFAVACIVLSTSREVSAEAPLAGAPAATQAPSKPLSSATGGTNSSPAAAKRAGSVTNAPANPTLDIRGYTLVGNTLLPDKVVRTVVEDYVGPKSTFDTIQQAMEALQLAYKGRGFATVSLSLPQQKLTNGIVRIHVSEGKLTIIRVTGNHWYSADNVRRALPSLHTNLLLNGKVFEAELDVANNNPDRQIYPRLSAGPDPGTSALELRVKDQIPLHGRFELNNQFTPGTPELRGNATAQYNNLWQREHSLGLQYGFALQDFKDPDHNSLFDRPLIANYSGYYRIPLGSAPSVQREIDANPRSFGYDEVSRQFRLPPSQDRPSLTVYASRSTTDTGTHTTATTTINPPPIALYSFDSGQDFSTTEGVGFRFSVPLPEFHGIRSSLSLGTDLKNYQRESLNTNNFIEDFTYTNPSTGAVFHNTIPFSSPQPVRSAHVSYLPIAIRWDGSKSDRHGATSYGLGVNQNFAGGPFSDSTDFQVASSSTESSGTYTTVQMNAGREQKIGGEWTVWFKADGQWANQPLISNEQFGMGGTASPRGYIEGERYGDTGWRMTIEPRTPVIDIGMVDGTMPMRVRGVVFMDYGQSYLIDTSVSHAQQDPAKPNDYHATLTLLGTGCGVSGTIGSHFDMRAMVGFPIFDTSNSKAGVARFYFAVSAQF